MYDSILKIINTILSQQHTDELNNSSVLLTILETEGLDERDKISGVIGELAWSLVGQLKHQLHIIF